MAFTRQEMEETKRKKVKETKLPGLVPFRDGFAPQESELPEGKVPLAEGFVAQEDVPQEALPEEAPKDGQPALIKRSIAKGTKKTSKALDDLQEGITGEKTNKDNKMSDDMKTALLAGLPILIGGLIGGEDGLGAGAEAAQVGLGVQAKEQAVEAQGKAKQQEIAIKQQEADAKTADAQGKADLRLSQIGLNKVKTLTAIQKGLPKAASAKFQGLSSENQKRLSSIISGDRAITQMTMSIQSGENLFEVLGESKYTDARNRFVEAIARLQSGAAISEKEFDIFTGFTPSTVEARAIVEEKMRRNRQFMSDNLMLSGFTRAELNLPVAPPSLQSKDELLARKAELEQMLQGR